MHHLSLLLPTDAYAHTTGANTFIQVVTKMDTHNVSGDIKSIAETICPAFRCAKKESRRAGVNIVSGDY